MKHIVLYGKINKHALLEHVHLYSKNLVIGLGYGLIAIARALFVPVKLYKQEGSEVLPREVHLRDEYQKFQIPRGPFC